MTNTQIKALQYISDILSSIESYPVYKSISDAIEDAGIENDIRLKIVNKYQDAINIEINKVKSAKTWIDTLLSDTKPQ